MVPEFEYPPDRVLEYYTILIPNVDNTRTLYLIDIIARQEKAVLLIGTCTPNIILVIGFVYFVFHELIN